MDKIERKLSTTSKIIISIVTILCVAILAFVVWLFNNLEEHSDIDSNNQNITQKNGTEETSGIEKPVFTPDNDGPVYFGVTSSISIDCIDKDFVENEIIDRLFYLNIPKEDYTIVRDDKLTKIKIGIKNDKNNFEKLYGEVLDTIYSSNCERHLENGLPVDNEEDDIVGDKSYLTVNLYNKLQ